MLRTAHGGIQRKRAGVGEAVENALAPCDFGNGEAVVFLVKEKSGFLSVFKIHGIFYSVFDYFRFGEIRVLNPLKRIPALVFGKSLKASYGNVVTFVNSAYFLSVVGKYLVKCGKNYIFVFFYAH